MRNQRARIYGGMLNSVVERGYSATTVGDVICLAGVSRKTFYEHFDDKHECLQATHQALVGQTRARVIEAWRCEQGWANQLHAACDALFDDVRRHPKGAHLVLVDSLGIAGARERTILSNLPFERLVHATLRPHARSATVPMATPCAIVGGIRQVIFTRVLRHRQRELDTLAAEVLDWLDCYRLPHARLPPVVAEPSRQLHTARCFLKREGPHARILEATFRLGCELGYARITDAQLARCARMPTQELHKWFPSKEACFLALIDAFMQEALQVAWAQMHDGAAWPAEAHRAICVYTEMLTSHQALLRLAFAGLFDLGPGMLHQMTKPIEALVAMLIDLGPPIDRGRSVALEAIAGAIWWTIFKHVGTAAASSPMALADQLAFIVLAPVVGARRAELELRVARTLSIPAPADATGCHR